MSVDAPPSSHRALGPATSCAPPGLVGAIRKRKGSKHKCCCETSPQMPPAACGSWPPGRSCTRSRSGGGGGVAAGRRRTASGERRHRPSGCPTLGGACSPVSLAQLIGDAGAEVGGQAEKAKQRGGRSARHSAAAGAGWQGSQSTAVCRGQALRRALKAAAAAQQRQRVVRSRRPANACRQRPADPVQPDKPACL